MLTFSYLTKKNARHFFLTTWQTADAESDYKKVGAHSQICGFFLKAEGYAGYGPELCYDIFHKKQLNKNECGRYWRKGIFSFIVKIQ